jgi:cold-inducible RNA-binding protein
VNPVRAEKALKQLEGATISGSTLHAEPAKPPKSRDERRGGGGGGAAEEANSSLHVRNIGPESTQESIKALFAPYGEVREVRLPKNRETGANAGFGFVEFETSGQAAAALAKLNHATLDGRTIDVAYSRNKALGGGRRDGRDDDRRGGRDGYAGGRDYGHGPPPPMMGYPAYPGYPAAGGRGGAPAFPYGYMPYGMPMAAAGGRGGRETGTAFPAAYPGGQAAYPYMDPRYMAQYAMMAAQQQQGGMPGAMPGAGGFGGPASAKKDRRRDDSRSPSRSRSRSPPRRGGSRSRSRSRSRDRKRR